LLTATKPDQIRTIQRNHLQLSVCFVSSHRPVVCASKCEVSIAPVYPLYE